MRRNRFLVDGTYSCEGDRQYDPPRGVFGGWDGLVATCRKNPDTAREENLQAKVTGIPFGAGDVIEFREPNGGGYGDPLERAPEAVREDVLDDFTTLELARDAYGVVFATNSRSRSTRRRRPAAGELPRAGTGRSLTEYYAERGLIPGPRPWRSPATASSASREPKAYEQSPTGSGSSSSRGARPRRAAAERGPLAREFGVSRATVREALRLLAAQSLIRTARVRAAART